MECITIVLASPSDLANEREEIVELIAKKDRIYKKQGITFDLRRWEDTVPNYNQNGGQGVIDEDLKIEDADLFICMFWKRFGTVIPQFNEVGTEHELNRAIESKEKKGNPNICLFVKNISENDKGEEYQKMKSYIDSISTKVLYNQFDNSKDLLDKIDAAIAKEVYQKKSIVQNVYPESKTIVECKNIEELVNALSPNKIFYLKSGIYEINNMNLKNPCVKIEPVFDGSQIVIEGLSNVQIISNSSKVVVEPRYANVFTFRNCTNILLSGFTLGHIPHRGSCIGSAVGVEDSYNVEIRDCKLFGCGAYGAVIRSSNDVILNSCEIFECTDGGILATESRLIVKNSIVYDCDVNGSLFALIDCSAYFQNVLIEDNTSYGPVFGFADQSYIRCKAVSLIHNKYPKIGLDEDEYIFLVDNQVCAKSDD